MTKMAIVTSRTYRATRVIAGLVLALMWVSASWASTPSTWQKRLSESAGAKYTRALEAAARQDKRTARKLLGQLLWRLRGTPAGAAVRRRLAKLDPGAAFHYAITLDVSLTQSNKGQRTRKQRKMRLIFSAKKAFKRKFKLKAGAAMLVVNLHMTPGVGLFVKGWTADKKKVKRFNWTAIKLRRGAKQKRRMQMALGSIATAVSVTALGIAPGAKPPVGSKPVPGRPGVRMNRRTQYRVKMRNATAKRVIERLAEINGLTPVWAPGLKVERRLTLELKLSSKASSRLAVLTKMCKMIGLRCVPKGKKVFVTKAPPRPKAPRAPAVPAVPKRAGGKTPTPPTPPRGR